jgi:hypothetical protein
MTPKNKRKPFLERKKNLMPVLGLILQLTLILKIANYNTLQTLEVSQLEQ